MQRRQVKPLRPVYLRRYARIAWHTVLDLLEPPWRKAREAAENRMSFAYLVTLTTFVVFPAWSDLLEALATFTISSELLKTQIIE